MNAAVVYLTNQGSAAEIAEHLKKCDQDFVPPLSARVHIDEYAKKIVSNAMRFEAWSGATLVGLIATYCNDREKRVAYITSVSVVKDWMGQGVAAHLLGECIAYARTSGMEQIRLEVSKDNLAAVRLYEKGGFVAGDANAPLVPMTLDMKVT
jgi:ribosomal protein S18 acetylase RimI-like enzyme